MIPFMAERDPMFGQRHAPYKDGTGNSQSGPSAERQEREDEEGISQARQTLVLGFIEREGVLGLTYRELCKYTGWVGGQATGALSALDTMGKVVRLDERRERQSVYVLEKFRQGRKVAKRRESAADKARRELDQAKVTIGLLEERVSVALTAMYRSRDDANLHAADANLHAAKESELRDALEHSLSNVEKLIQQNLTLVAEARLARERLEQVTDELSRMTRENSAHRISAHLRMTLEPDESATVLRVGTLLGNPRFQEKPDSDEAKITLGVIRTLMRIVGRTTKFGSDAVTTG